MDNPDILIRKEIGQQIDIETNLSIPEAIYLLEMAKIHLCQIQSQEGCSVKEIAAIL